MNSEKLTITIEKMTSKDVTARKKRHRFKLQHEKSDIILRKSTKKVASFCVRARKIRHRFKLKHEKISIKTY